MSEADSYSLLGFPLTIRSRHPPLAEALRWHLEPFRIAGVAGAHLVVDIQADAEAGWRYLADGVEQRRGPARRILRHALWDVHGRAWREVDRYLFVHAGAVARGSEALLLPARMEAGKSTLTAMLLRRGWDYLSDELGVLDPEGSAVRAFPKHVTLAPESLRWLPDVESCLVDREGLNAALPERYARPVDLGSRISGNATVAEIAFLTNEWRGPARRSVLSKGEALAELGRHCFNLARHGATGIDLLADLVGHADVYRIEGGSPPERADLVARH